MASSDYLKQTELGKQSTHVEAYTPALLTKIERALTREVLGLQAHDLPFDGVDIWNAYEVSWLNPKGKPQVGMLQIQVPADSACLIESKSLKLYLGSFNQSIFDCFDTLQQTVSTDLSRVAEASITVDAISDSAKVRDTQQQLEGQCLDGADVEISAYEPDASLLVVDRNTQVCEAVYSDLFRSNCPVTSQPDWASVSVRYEGGKIDHESLLKYLVSFRKHTGFHENCVERIFVDLMQQCSPEKLSVYARYTRRGGLDINPFRSNFEKTPLNYFLPRQ